MTDLKEKKFSVKVIRDVQYGVGIINKTTEPIARPLCMDVYLPAISSEGCQRQGLKRPALIMAFGGAYHRGSKEADEFDIEGHHNTPVSEYCYAFASRGYAAFSIDYRLVQEDPAPTGTPIILNKQTIVRSRMDHVRKILGLEPASIDMLWAGIESAVDDMSQAFEYVYDHASDYSIDISRIALGGFSAGARIAASAAYGKKVPAAAVIALSGMIGAADGQRLINSTQNNPPVMMVMGENDLDFMKELCKQSHAYLNEFGVINELWEVPGGTHFYPSTSSIHPIEDSDSVHFLEQAMSDFLYRSMRLHELSNRPAHQPRG